MKQKHFRRLTVVILMVGWLAVAIYLIAGSQSQEISRLNQKLREARQEIADKTNRIYELKKELDGRRIGG